MHPSKCVLVWYSLNGNIESVVRKVQSETECSSIQLQPGSEPPKKGFYKYVSGGGSALYFKKASLVNREEALQARNSDLVVLLWPIWAGTLPPAMHSFLELVPLHDRNIILVASSASGNAQKCLAATSALLEKEGNRILKVFSLQNPLKSPEKNSQSIQDLISLIRQYSRPYSAT